MILLLSAQKRTEEALAYAERAKARVLLDVPLSVLREMSRGQKSAAA